jgi:hypothetical protein
MKLTTCLGQLEENRELVTCACERFCLTRGRGGGTERGFDQPQQGMEEGQCPCVCSENTRSCRIPLTISDTFSKSEVS